MHVLSIKGVHAHSQQEESGNLYLLQAKEIH